MTTEPEISPTWGAQLAHAEHLLAAAGSPEPQREAAELLSHVLGMPGPVLRARPTTSMAPSAVEWYATWVARRAAGEALPHITGHLEFMGLDLTIAPGGALPMPIAQRLVEMALEWARYHLPGELRAAELGTGCGAIALALAALEPRFTRIYALDPSAVAVEAARANGARYLLNLVVEWREGEDLDGVPEPVDLIVCAVSNRLMPGERATGTASVSAAAQPAMPSTMPPAIPLAPDLVRLLEWAPTKLRPHGALICGLDGAPQRTVSDLLARTLPAADMWIEPYGAEAGASSVFIVQLPRDPAWRSSSPDREGTR
jgi:SAM-dependent methyltransferase